MKENRPSPEALLQQVREEELKAHRGKLKIYLGAAPGVGKTYTMLEDATAKRSQGVDVVAGVLESHGRHEIEAMLSKINILPRLQVEYRGKQFLEFDLDGTLQRNPALVLIDEMAHTNVPGLRHNKRWQDIKEILDRGIDVYTTLNVQHIESINDIVSEIVHVPIKETVPDFMIDMADTIELVDLPPEDLLKRLEEGKVYFSAQAELARENFFKKGNLIALRELALQATSARVTTQALLYRRSAGISQVWPIKAKILVCVGSRYASIKLIRVAIRLAALMQAELHAVHVDTPRVRLSEEQQAIAMQNLNFAEKEGAKTKILNGLDIVNEIMQYARAQNVTLIVVWKQVRPRWKELLFRSLADEILRNSGEIDVHVVTGLESASKTSTRSWIEQPTDWTVYGISLMVIAAMTAINFLLDPYVENNNLIMIYLLGVIMVALYGNLKASIFTSVLSVFLFSALYASHPFSFMLSDLQYSLTLGVMLLMAYVISHLIILSKRQAEMARIAEQETSILNALMHNLVTTRGVEERLKNSLRYLSDLFKAQVLSIMPVGGVLKVRASYKSSEKMNEKEKAVAGWVFEMGQMAGLGTDTLPSAEALYVPLRASKGPIGVLALQPIPPKSVFTSEEIRLLNSCASQIALSLEVDRLEEVSKRSEFKSAANRMRTVLLQAVSKDLHQPLMSAMKLTKELFSTAGEQKKIIDIANSIYLDLDQLRHLITNILHIAYTEPAQLKLKIHTYVLKDLIQESLKSLERKLGNKPVLVDIPVTLPLIPLDKTLMKEVMFNLIDNAIKFSDSESPIEISAVMQKDKVIVSVEDRGVGIAEEEMGKLFDKFYRGQTSSERGLGLGLAICRNVVIAHGGEIKAENRKGGGASFRFSLPLA